MLCLRYNCVGKTLYTLVVPPDGMADVYADPDFAFILIDGAWGSLEGTGMYVGLGNPLPSDATSENTISGSPVTTWGWEASFPLEPGTHTITVFNCNATTYEFVSTDLVTDPYGLALNLVCVGGTTGTGTGTPGYWKNHLEAWPQNGITIGETSYGVYEAIAIMDTPGKGDRTYTMFRALVAAKLNVWNGCDSSCIVSTIVAADEWMTQYGPVGSGVDGKSTAWADGEPLATMLDDYNNGLLCAPARE